MLDSVSHLHVSVAFLVLNRILLQCVFGTLCFAHKPHLTNAPSDRFVGVQARVFPAFVAHPELNACFPLVCACFLPSFFDDTCRTLVSCFTWISQTFFET